MGDAAFRLMATYNQFQLVDAGDAFEELRLPDDYSLVHDSDGLVVVTTGSNGAPVSVQVDQFDAQPAALSQEWEDAVEFSVVARHGVALCELFEGAHEPVSGPGTFRIRIAARGRDEGERHADVGRQGRAIEHFLVQLWPSVLTDGLTIKATSLRTVDHTTGRVHLADAREAAARVNADLARMAADGPIVGATGTVTAEWTYRTSARKLFRAAAFPHWWSSAAGSHSSTTPAAGVEYRMSHNDYRAIWDGIPTGPSHVWINAVISEIKKPTAVLSDWTWVTGQDYGHSRPLLQTRLSVQLVQHDEPDDAPQTTLQIRHDGLPATWLNDMHLCWLCKLEAGEKVYRLAE